MKAPLMVSVNEEDLNYFNEIKIDAKKKGILASAVFHEFVIAHKEKHEGELK